MEEKLSKDKEQKTAKESIIKTILISAITVIITQAIIYFFWTRQFENTKKQKLLEYKISSYEKFSNTALKASYLFEFASRLKFEQYIEERKIADSLFVLKGFRDSTLNTDDRYLVHDKLKQKYPLIYDKYMAFLDFQNEYYSSATTAQLQFNNEIKEEINVLSESLSEETIFHYIKEEMDKKGVDIYSLNKDKIVSSLFKKRSDQILSILNAMLKEIKED